jgi:poly(3-hydroxybutyrate) depolymerase
MGKHLLGLFSRQDGWKRFMKAGPITGVPFGSPAPDHLTETLQFGSNPGALRMFSYIPPGLQDGCPLVVVLHGCTQTAASYDLGAGWSTLAERFGFALLLPEQQWFQSGDIERGHGEAASIR